MRRRPRRALAVAMESAHVRAGEALKRFGAAAGFVLVGFLGGLGYALFAPPTYTAAAFVLVVEEGADGAGTGPASVSFAQVYGRLAPLPETLRYSTVPLPRMKPGTAREHIQASTSPDAPLVRLAGRAGTAEEAARFANAAADALVRYGESHHAETGVRVALMTRAEKPDAPTSPNMPVGIAVGTATGALLAGLGAAVLSGRRGRGGRRGRPGVAVPAPAGFAAPAGKAEAEHAGVHS